MALIAQQKIDKSGDAKAYAACGAGGDTFLNSEGVLVHIKYVGGGSSGYSIVAITDPLSTVEAGELAVGALGTVFSGADESMFSVPASHTGSGGVVTIIYPLGVTDLTIAVLQVQQ